MAVSQNMKEARPPDKKFDRPGDIYPKSEGFHPYLLLKYTSYGVPCSPPKARISICQARYLIWTMGLDRKAITHFYASLYGVAQSDPQHMAVHETLTNMKKKLLRKAKLPPKPLQSPRTPLALTICRTQSIGPLNFRSMAARSRCSCRLTIEVVKLNSINVRLSLKRVPLRSSTGWATIALL